MAPFITILAACDPSAGTAPVASGAQSAAAPAGSEQQLIQQAREACGREVAGPNGLIRVEFARRSSTGAVIMLHARRDPASTESQRWRCNYDARTGAVHARAVS